MWLNHTDLGSYANEAADSFTLFLFKQEENCECNLPMQFEVS